MDIHANNMSRQPLSRLLRISSSKKRSLLQIHIKWTIFNVSYKDCKNTYFCYTYCLSDSFFFISALQWYIVSVWQEPSGKHPWPGSSGKHKETSSLTHAVKPTSPNTPPSAVQQLWRLWWSLEEFISQIHF